MGGVSPETELQGGTSLWVAEPPATRQDPPCRPWSGLTSTEATWAYPGPADIWDHAGALPSSDPGPSAQMAALLLSHQREGPGAPGADSDGGAPGGSWPLAGSPDPGALGAGSVTPASAQGGAGKPEKQANPHCESS